MPISIGYDSSKLEKLCLESKATRKQFPQVAAGLLQQRLFELAAFDSLGAIPSGAPLHFHALTGNLTGHFAIRIDKKHRIVFRPGQVAETETPGMVDLGAVTEIIVVRVGDYHK